jgi:hypothetical protein
MKRKTTMKTMYICLTGKAGSFFTAVAALLLTAAFINGCGIDQPTANDSFDESVIVSDILALDEDAVLNISTATASLLKQVRQRTARFNSSNQAIRAGYLPDDHCVAHPEMGGMGYHWLNPGLLDDEFDPLQPEVILYERHKNGSMRLIGVEYIVMNTGQDHPHFGDYPFDVGGTPIPAPHWSLHVWVHKNNPSGMFAPYNPTVSCP